MPPVPLPAPDHAALAELSANPAVQLLVARTRAQRPDFALSEGQSVSLDDASAFALAEEVRITDAQVS